MDNIDKGLILENAYRQKLLKKLVGDANIKEQLADRIMGVSNGRELDAYSLKPVYEELRKIPLDEQMRLMQKQFQSLPQSLPPELEEDRETKTIKDTFPLYKGQRLS